jgi:hypothetical protein
MSIWNRIYNHVRGRVWDRVDISVTILVYNHVRGRVWDRVGNRVRARAHDRALEEINW